MVYCPSFILSIIITTRYPVNLCLRCYFERPISYFSHKFISLSADIFLSSLLLSDFLFLSKYIHLPSIINVSLICSGSIWRSSGHNCWIISLLVLLTHLLPFTSLLGCYSLSFIGISYLPTSLGLKTIFCVSPTLIISNPPTQIHIRILLQKIHLAFITSLCSCPST